MDSENPRSYSPIAVSVASNRAPEGLIELDRRQYHSLTLVGFDELYRIEGGRLAVREILQMTLLESKINLTDDYKKTIIALNR